MQFPPNFEERIFIMAGTPRLTNFAMHEYLRRLHKHDNTHFEQNNETYDVTRMGEHTCDFNFFRVRGSLIDKFDPILMELYREYGNLIAVPFSYPVLISIPKCFKQQYTDEDYKCKIDTNLYKFDTINAVIDDASLNDTEKIYRIKEITQMQICGNYIERIDINGPTLQKMLLTVINCDMLACHEKIADIYDLLDRYSFELHERECIELNKRGYIYYDNETEEKPTSYYDNETEEKPTSYYDNETEEKPTSYYDNETEEKPTSYYDNETNDEKIDLAIYKKLVEIRRNHKKYKHITEENFEECDELLKIMINALTGES